MRNQKVGLVFGVLALLTVFQTKKSHAQVVQDPGEYLMQVDQATYEKLSRTLLALPNAKRSNRVDTYLESYLNQQILLSNPELQTRIRVQEKDGKGRFQIGTRTARKVFPLNGLNIEYSLRSTSAADLSTEAFASFQNTTKGFSSALEAGTLTSGQIADTDLNLRNFMNPLFDDSWKEWLTKVDGKIVPIGVSTKEQVLAQYVVTPAVRIGLTLTQSKVKDQKGNDRFEYTFEAKFLAKNQQDLAAYSVEGFAKEFSSAALKLGVIANGVPFTPSNAIFENILSKLIALKL